MRAKHRYANQGLTEFCRRRGCSISHAWRVITGKRESRSLMDAWMAFKKRQEGRS